MKNLQQNLLGCALALGILGTIGSAALHLTVIAALPYSTELPKQILLVLLATMLLLGTWCGFLIFRMRRNVRQIWVGTGYFQAMWKVHSFLPRWLRIAFWVLLAYLLISIVSVEIFDSRYQVQQGVAQQFAATAILSFGFAGLSMILFLGRRMPELVQTKRCPNGHTIASIAKVCPYCGPALSGTWTQEQIKQ